MKHAKERTTHTMLIWSSTAVLVICFPLLVVQADNKGDSIGSCNVTIRSTAFSIKNGSLHSPNWPKVYANNLRCVYNFIALPHERVRVRFTDFSVKGSPPRCSNDYVDVYTQVREPFQDLLDVPLHGRYCGSDIKLLPRLFISMYHVFVVGFYTDQHKEDRGFNAEYQFIDGSIYNVGTPATSPSVCGQTVFSDRRSVGEILSPTYPGTYPDNLFCYYRLQGVPGQRIRLTFVDIDLYSGGDHCPYDYIRVYDGPSNVSEAIVTYCGRWRDATIYSSAESMYVEFVTKSGRAEPTRRPSLLHNPLSSSSSAAALGDVGYLQSNVGQLGRGRDAFSTGFRGGSSSSPAVGRSDNAGGGGGGSGSMEEYVQRSGFKARFEITGGFIDLDFIREAQHVRGTECDQMVLSGGESTGVITSPNYPNNYPLNVTCHYYIDGLVDKQNLEKAKLDFAGFDIPAIRDGCTNGFLSVYIHGQDITSSPPDYRFCGHTIPGPLVTSNPRLLVIFNTTGARYAGRGFKARYQFVTDYAIPGTPAPTGACHAFYRSSPGSLQGSFNSPRHPSSYPDNMTCTYEFFGNPNEQVRITFENFKLENNRKNCSTDYVEVYSLTTSTSAADSVTNAELSRSVTSASRLGRYCNEQLPGPLMSEESDSSMRIVFVSNVDGINTGFKAKYEFVERKAPAKRCFKNITSGYSGHIDSPNYPHKYLISSSCEWLITGRNRDSRILLTFDIFTMEGNMDKAGCGNAALRIFSDASSTMASHELCGATPQVQEIISRGNSMKIRFISSARATGGKGFKLWWTEIQLPPVASAAAVSAGASGDVWCNGFQCRHSGYCIASELRCNKVPNCGKADPSDENLNCNSYRDHGVLQAVLGVVAALATIVLIVVCIVHRRRKREKRMQKSIAQPPRGGSIVSTGHHGNSTSTTKAVGDGVASARGAAAPGGGASTIGNNGDTNDATVEVRYVSRTVAATNAVVMTTTTALSSPAERTGTANRRSMKEKTEKVSIV